MVLVLAWHMGSYSLTRNWTCIPCIARWILNHWITMEVPIHCLLMTPFCMSFLEKCLLRSSVLFLFILLLSSLLLICIISLYTLYINVLLDNIVHKCFLSFHRFPLVLLMVSFGEQKLFSFMYLHLLIFAFIAFIFCVISKKNCCPD